MAQNRSPASAFVLPVEQKTTFREGHDFSTPEELEALRAEGAIKEQEHEPAASERVLALAQRMLQEIIRYQQFEGFPNGRPWGEQAWWRIWMYEAFFAGLNARGNK